MGYLDDVNSIVKTVLDVGIPVDNMPKKSIAERASDGTFQFGFLVADSMSIDSAATLARTAERTYASFVQTVISMNNTLNITAPNAIPNYIKALHKNMREAAEETSTLADGSVYVEAVNLNTDAVYSDKLDTLFLSFESGGKITRALQMDMKTGQRYILEDVDEFPFPDVSSKPMFEKKDSLTRSELIRDALANKSSGDQARYKDFDVNKTPTLLNDRDIKKQNDTQPFLMTVRLTGVNDQNEFVNFVDFIVGVKVNLHLIRSNEMVENLVRSVTEKNAFFKFIRWTTGEISFAKDFLLSIDETKNKIAARSSGSNPYWAIADRMRDRSKTAKKLFVPGKYQFVPNSTIAITGYEVDKIKDMSGYDVSDANIAHRIMDALFLMTFIIVDEGTSTVKIMYNYEKSFKVIALETLERETMQSTNRLGKELLRMTVR